uniref:Uncharacterized protein n=2 Tax=Biomphalaria glabrata TaxID=6526 RepID=A0A2C9LM65_BIOGL
MMNLQISKVFGEFGFSQNKLAKNIIILRIFQTTEKTWKKMASASNRPPSDVETDAEPETGSRASDAYASLGSRASDTYVSLGSRASDTYVSQESSASPALNGLEAEMDKMDINLKMNNFEILIMHCDDDEDDERAVRYFKKQLEENVSYLKFNKRVNPKVELYSEVSLESNTPTRDLELPLQKALFVFLYVTKSFCKSGMSMFDGEASLINNLRKQKPDNFILVIHTKPEKTRDYTLNMRLDALNYLYFSKNEKKTLSFIVMLAGC